MTAATTIPAGGPVVVEVPDGSQLARLLPRAERVLVAVASVERLAGRGNSTLPEGLSSVAEVALAALYRTWGLLGDQLQAFRPATDPFVAAEDSAPRRVRLSAGDLAILARFTDVLVAPEAATTGLLSKARVSARDLNGLLMLVALLGVPHRELVGTAWREFRTRAADLETARDATTPSIRARPHDE